MATLNIPESPRFITPPSTPRLDSPDASTSRHHEPQSLHDPSPETLLPLLEEARRLRVESANKGKGNDLRTRVILRHALRWGVQRGDVDLVGWLVSLRDEWATILDEEVEVMEDDDGWGIVGMAIQTSCGRQDIEEIVRQVVSRWTPSIGPRQGRDHNGWTALHLAGLVSTPPLVSFLLNRGASPHALTRRGLTPLDLVAGIPERADIAMFLEHGQGEEVDVQADTLSARRKDVLQRRHRRAAERMWKSDKAERMRMVNKEKERWVRSLAPVVEVSPGMLLPPDKSRDYALDEGLAWCVGMEGPDEEKSDDEMDEENEVDDHLMVGPPQYDGFDTMLVFSLSGLPTLLDIFITDYPIHCQPTERRNVPANAIYLYARFAYYRCDANWLEELLDGAIERIEQVVYDNAEDLAFLAFWAYSTTLLLYVLRSDRDLAAACENESLNLLSMIQELINAIHVFIIRFAERRIDVVLDAALLDYETLEDFDDVRFAGEWILFRSFGAKRRKDLVPKASQIFPGLNSVTSTPEPAGSRTPSLLGALRQNVAAVSPLRSLSARDTTDAPSVVARSPNADSLATATPTNEDAAVSPRQITDILSAVLMVLQLYEINPAVIIQSFSQIFFWIACELFNRILTRKKYLCRSKAVQIRMNITALEDWVRANTLPIQMATKYLEPVNQLLTWLQCLSQIRDFDALIGTVQNLKTINPLQMRRAVRDYRYEVNEGSMAEECGQYLAQFQRDWERSRLDKSVDPSPWRADGPTPTSIDDLFEGDMPLVDFIPPSPPVCLGELLDSRFMLPFTLPSKSEYLIATPPAESAFANANLKVNQDGPSTSRPSSRSSFASTRPMSWVLPCRKSRRLPTDFFPWLEAEEARRRYRPVRTGLGDTHDEANNSSAAFTTPTKLRAVDGRTEQSATDDDTPSHSQNDHPPMTASRPISLPPGFPSPGLRTSDSLDRLREAARIPFEPVVEGRLRREESFEMKPRGSPIKIDTPYRGPIDSDPAFSPSSPLYRLKKARLDLGTPESLAGAPAEDDPGSPLAERSGRGKLWSFTRSASSTSTIKPDPTSPISR